jgi:DNA-binding CsgD family transcriptional regulator
MSERYGAIFWQAASLYQLTYLEIAFGDFARAQEDGGRANTLMARQGPYRESDVLAMETAFCFAYYLEGDWPAIAAFWTRFVIASSPSAQDISLLAGLLYAAMAAVAHTRAGADGEARRLLDYLTPVLRDVDLTTGNQNQNGAVAFAADAIWDLGAGDLAATYRDLAHRLIAAGIGDYPQTSLELTLARMSALRGDLDAASRHFAAARPALERSGQRPLRAIVDYDEALALLRSSQVAAEATRIRFLLETARTEFRVLGMERWTAKSLTALDDLTARLAIGRTAFPAGLTEREVDVLRLVVRGYSDRQISDELYISQRTVNAHLRNMLGKTDLANRTELSVWAVEHGLVSHDDA